MRLLLDIKTLHQWLPALPVWHYVFRKSFWYKLYLCFLAHVHCSDCFLRGFVFLLAFFPSSFPEYFCSDRRMCSNTGFGTGSI